MHQEIGQALGILAVIFGFITYQQKTPKGILLFDMFTALIFSAHYYLIGAYTATALNFLGAVKCVIYLFREKRGSKSLWEPLIFVCITVFTSILIWEGWYSSLIMIGLVTNTVSLALSNAQKTRYCMFIKSPLCLVYNGIVHSGGGVIYECAVLISSVIGILRNRSPKKESDGVTNG
jgi:uncharacterized membrane protein (UPF0136 family)